MFQDKYRLGYLKNVVNTQEPEESHTFLAKPEEEWCAIHNLAPAAFKNISEICMSFPSTSVICESRYSPSTIMFITYCSALVMPFFFPCAFSNIVLENCRETVEKGSSLFCVEVVFFPNEVSLV